MLSEHQITTIIDALRLNLKQPRLSVIGEKGAELTQRAQVLAADLRAAGLVVDNISAPYQSSSATYDIDVEYHCDDEARLIPELKNRLQQDRHMVKMRVDGYVKKITAAIKKAVEEKPSNKDFVIFINFPADLNELKMAAAQIFQDARGTTYEVTSDYIQYANEVNLRIKNLTPAQFVPSQQIDRRAQEMHDAAMKAIEALIISYPQPSSDRWTISYNPSHEGEEYLLRAMRAKGLREGTFGVTNSYIQYQSETNFWVLKTNFPELKAREIAQAGIKNQEAKEAEQKHVNDVVERLVFEFDELIFNNNASNTWTYQGRFEYDNNVLEKIAVDFKKKFPGLQLKYETVELNSGRGATRYTASIDPTIKNDEKLNRLLRRPAAQTVSTSSSSPAPLRMSQPPRVADSAKKDLNYYLGELLKHARAADETNYQNTIASLFDDSNISVPENVMASLMTVIVQKGQPTRSDAIVCLERLLKEQLPGSRPGKI